MPFGRTVNAPALNRARLVEALRNVPETYEWDFETYYIEKSCGTAGCAIGLAHTIWPEAGLLEIQDLDYANVESHFGMSEDQIGDVFYHEGYPRECFVTPEMVADKLEKLG